MVLQRDILLFLEARQQRDSRNGREQGYCAKNGGPAQENSWTLDDVYGDSCYAGHARILRFVSKDELLLATSAPAQRLFGRLAF